MKKKITIAIAAILLILEIACGKPSGLFDIVSNELTEILRTQIQAEKTISKEVEHGITN